MRSSTMKSVATVVIAAVAAAALAWASGGWVSNGSVPSVKVWRDGSYHWDWKTSHDIKVSLTGSPNESYQKLYLYKAVSSYPTIKQCSASQPEHAPYVDEANIWHWWWYFEEIPPHYWGQFAASCVVCDSQEGPGGAVWVMAWETHQGATPPRRKAAYAKEVP